MNYSKEMDKIIADIKERKIIPSILLHSCCAPCSSHVIKTLTPYFNITILYYNPNIEPYEEYLKRKNEEIRFINEFPNKNNLDIIDCDYDNDKFHQITKNMENIKEGGIRCFNCYRLRLSKTAQIAKEKGYDYFGTTLTVSPYKNSQKINEIGLSLAKDLNINYLCSDFKKKEGYKDSINMSKEYNLYRQDYCGCIYSYKEREEQKMLKEKRSQNEQDNI